MTKEEVIKALETGREEFMRVIDGLSDEELAEPGVIYQWSVKDLMAHINAWEAELIKLLWQAKQGQKPTSAQFGKLSVDDQNQAWYEETKDRPLERIQADFEAVRKQTERRVEAFSDKDLNDVERYPWLGGHPLWEWIASDSYEHEAEHAAQIKKWRSGKDI